MKAKKKPPTWTKKVLLCGAKTKDGKRCTHVVSKRGNTCYSHRPVVDAILPQPSYADWRNTIGCIVEARQWVDVRSESRPDVIHHVYTGDEINGFHCTCEAFRWENRKESELTTCKHINLVVFGKGAA